MTQEIQLPRKLANQLLHLAQISPKHEICGLISAKNGLAQHCYPIQNVAEQPEKQFLLAPHQQINALTKIREKGETLFAIYHSHPTAPAQPSQEDICLSAYPDALNFIISLNTKGILEMQCFKYLTDSAIEIPLSLSDDPACVTII